MGTSTINIALPQSLKDEVEEIVAADGYGNTSEFFRDLVRGYLRDKQNRKLEALLIEGIESGEPTPLTRQDFEEIKRRAFESIKRKQAAMAIEE